MKARLTRRGALGLLGAGALIGLAGQARASGTANLSPPAGPMLFRHRARRPLIGDAAILTQRDYEIRFEPLPQGYRVTGGQVASAIDAPADLAPMAELWKKTVNANLFPFSIDASGLLVPGSGPVPTPVLGFGEMIDVGLDMLRKSGSTEAEISDARTFLRWLQQAAVQISTDIPQNLLVPPTEMERDSRTLELPGGLSGTIEILFQGTTSPETGLIREAQRDVVTRTEGTSSQTIDNWSLAAI